MTSALEQNADRTPEETSSWKERLKTDITEDLGREIDIFETDISLRKQGKIDEKLFAEERLRRGVYGQRYDNGQRHDGTQTRAIEYPNGDLTKGPNTAWDAPGMMRIKIPMGRLSADQLDVLAELGEEYSDEILHVTTRQDIQLHFVHIEDTPDLMRRLAAVDITTREACGNAVRNVTACPFAGVCSGEPFDVTPYANALTYFLLGHDDTQDFGRKFKIAFSGCKEESCGLVKFHDLGAIAVTRTNEDGSVENGFELYVGGGLGAVPRQALLFDRFVPANELLPLSQAICRVFARLGEKKNRTRARLKFLVGKLGIEEFVRLVREERAIIPEDERWTAFLDDLDVTDDKPLKPGKKLALRVLDSELERWRETNVRPQRQPGYVAVTVRLPLGDFTSDQARALSDLARRYTGDTMRLTVEQDRVFRWVPEVDLPALHEGLKKLGLAQAGAGTLADITACPGTDTCKLGISASRGLAAVLEEKISAKLEALPPELQKLRIKTSGCFNSCGQHHVADVGFLGVSRNAGTRRVAHFQLVVGGQWENNGGAYGMPIGAFPAKRVPEVVDQLLELYRAEREEDEPFADFIKRAGRGKLKATLKDLTAIPDYEDDPSFYVDWGDAREYTIGDKGVGECAGELVTATQFGLQASERQVFEAQLALDGGKNKEAAASAYAAMLSAARTLVKIKNLDVTEDPDDIVGEFRTRFHETKVFHDPYAGAKFANYLLRTHKSPPNGVDETEARQHIEEAQLFVEAAHACFLRLQDTPVEEAKS